MSRIERVEEGCRREEPSPTKNYFERLTALGDIMWIADVPWIKLYGSIINRELPVIAWISLLGPNRVVVGYVPEKKGWAIYCLSQDGEIISQILPRAYYDGLLLEASLMVEEILKPIPD